MPRYTIQLVPDAADTVPPELRLRGALKVLLRVFRLRAVSVLMDDTAGAGAGTPRPPETADGAGNVPVRIVTRPGPDRPSDRI